MEPHDLAELLTRLRGEAEGVLDGTTCIHRHRQSRSACAPAISTVLSSTT